MPRVQSSSSDKKPATPIRPVDTPERASRVARASSGRSDTFTHDEIAERAYELFLARGSENGHDLEDWLEAERLVRDSAAGRKVTDTIQ